MATYTTQVKATVLQGNATVSSSAPAILSVVVHREPAPHVEWSVDVADDDANLDMIDDIDTTKDTFQLLLEHGQGQSHNYSGEGLLSQVSMAPGALQYTIIGVGDLQHFKLPDGL